jgi:hypothetical protein
MTGPDDCVILVCPSGAETASSPDEAARQLGILRRAYVYLEAGLTSRGAGECRDTGEREDFLRLAELFDRRGSVART